MSMFNPRKPEGNGFSLNTISDADRNGSSPAYAPATQPISLKSTNKANGSNSIIDEWLTMRGDLESEGDILVKGKVHGNVKCKLLIIDVEAVIEGGIVAEEVVVRGKTKGVIQANKVRLEKTAVVDSEICHQTFSAEEGARIKGALRFKEDPLAEPLKLTDSKAA